MWIQALLQAKICQLGARWQSAASINLAEIGTHWME
jgi:hypothetical protein